MMSLGRCHVNAERASGSRTVRTSSPLFSITGDLVRQSLLPAPPSPPPQCLRVSRNPSIPPPPPPPPASLASLVPRSALLASPPLDSYTD